MEHRRGIYFMLYLVTFSFAFILALRIAFSLGFSDSVIDSPWFLVFSQVSTLLFPLALWLAIFREKVNTHLPHMKLGKTNIILIVALSFLMQPAMMTISAITNMIFPNEIAGFMLERIDYPLWLMLLAMAVTPAICEEVVFRGYIQSTYKKQTFVTMALTNGLFFGIFHFNAHQFFYAFCMGIVFAYVVHATRSIRASVIMHFLVNTSQIMLLWFAAQMDEFLESAENIIEEMGVEYNLEATAELDFSQPEVIIALIMLGFIAVCSTIGAVIVLRYFAEHNRKRVLNYEGKLLSESTDEENAEQNETTLEEITTPSGKKNFLIDTLLILAIVALYVIFVFGI